MSELDDKVAMVQAAYEASASFACELADERLNSAEAVVAASGLDPMGFGVWVHEFCADNGPPYGALAGAILGFQLGYYLGREP